MATVLAIDFDGVIHDRDHPVEGRRMGPPMPGAKEAMSHLAARYELVVYTVMADTEQGRQVVEDWLKYYRIRHTRITAIKPAAAVYLDDRALRFVSWEQALPELKALLKPSR